MFPRAMLERAAELALSGDRREWNTMLVAALPLAPRAEPDAIALATDLVAETVKAALARVVEAGAFVDPPVGHWSKDHPETWQRGTPRELAAARERLLAAAEMIDCILAVAPEITEAELHRRTAAGEARRITDAAKAGAAR
ncbi:MAG: hypothetical protein JWM10_2560 [Myxococcaceae bacterium]|nr:hypothetical protein [Myxococcaceae bacterium]